jgi:hypothetical protein
MAAVVSGIPRARGAQAAVGITLSATEVCAVFSRAGDARARTWRAPLAPINGDIGAVWPDLVSALRALATESGVSDGALRIALMSPLAEVQVVHTPPLADEPLRQLLTRNAGKYFVHARGAQVVAVAPRLNARRADAKAVASAEAAPRVAVTAASRLLQTLYESARMAGWHIAVIVPAVAAWSEAARTFSERNSSGTTLLVVHDTHTDLLRIEHDQLAAVRRLRSGDADSADIEKEHGSFGGTLLLVGASEPRAALERALQARGLPVRVPTVGDRELIAAPDALAAAHMHDALKPALVTDAMRAMRARTIRALSTRLFGAAAALVLIGGALQLWGTQRELEAVRAEREALRPQLSATLVGRTTVETAFRQLAVLVAAERDAAPWSTVIGGVSDQLPPEAHLTGFRGRADTVGIDGLAMYAARVFDSIEQVPQLSGVHASAPVRRETTPEGDAFERFQITALLKRAPVDSTGAKR